jgi:hypothetical protein
MMRGRTYKRVTVNGREEIKMGKNVAKFRNMNKALKENVKNYGRYDDMGARSRKLSPPSQAERVTAE